PQALVDVVEKLPRLLPRARQPVQHARLDHVFGIVAFADEVDRAVVDRLHHVALGLQLRTSHDRTEAGNDPCGVVGQGEQGVHRIDATANPCAGEVIELRVAHGCGDVAYGKHVRVAEEHVDIAARVRFDQVAVVDPLAAGGHRSI